MKASLACLLTAVLAMSVAVVVGASAPDEGWTTRCRIVRVVDGDTVDVEVRKVIRVRMIDCWAPESRTTDKAEKELGLASKKHLRELVDGDADGWQVVHFPGHESLSQSLTLDRVAGTVWLDPEDEQSLNEIQVESGHATATKVR